MATCKQCNNEAGDYRLCTSCKKEWREIRQQAYQEAMDSVGDMYFDTSKEFRAEMKKREKQNQEKLNLINCRNIFLNYYIETS